MDKMPTAVLKSGIRIANFSSPHGFTFDDGTELGACSEDRSRALSLKAIENEIPRGDGAFDIELRFKMSLEVECELSEILRNMDDIDVVLVPFPVMNAWKAIGYPIGPLRCVRMACRQSKVASATKFCI